MWTLSIYLFQYQALTINDAIVIDPWEFHLQNTIFRGDIKNKLFSWAFVSQLKCQDFMAFDLWLQMKNLNISLQ